MRRASVDATPGVAGGGRGYAPDPISKRKEKSNGKDFLSFFSFFLF
jgi:hypothetical protein